MHGLGLIVRLNQTEEKSVEDTFVLKIEGTNGQARWLGLQNVMFHWCKMKHYTEDY